VGRGGHVRRAVAAVHVWPVLLQVRRRAAGTCRAPRGPAQPREG
jgi:hypothetical protein